MTTTHLNITFEGPQVSAEGVAVDDLQPVLERIQRAVRLMVEHLAVTAGTPDLAHKHSELRPVRISPGAANVQLKLAHAPNGQHPHDGYGPRALRAILDWPNNSSPALPEDVTNQLSSIGEGLSPEISAVWLGDPSSGQRLEFRRAERDQPRQVPDAKALLYGWLKEVNWARGTAQLHVHADKYVQLRFDTALNHEMHRLATQYVEVRGRGQFNKDDSWHTVHVEQISGTRSWREPFDLELFHNNPNPKIFDPDKMVSIDLTDEEWESYNRAIREGRTPQICVANARNQDAD